MPDKKSSEKETEDDAKGGGGGKRIAIAGVLSVGLLGGGFFAGGGLGGGGAAAEPAPAVAPEPEPEKKEIGKLIEMEPVNVNLQDGHYLRIAIALEKYTPEKDDGAAEEKKDAGEEEPFPTAPAADILLSTFSGRAMSELSTTSGREAVRMELFEGIVAIYGDAVTNVYLTEFVMQ